MTGSKFALNRPAKILIVDDHPTVREGLALRIARQPNLEVCGEASNLGEALQLLSKTNPDVAIIDISLKSGNGIDLLKRIRSRNKVIRLLVWSMYSESLYAERALRAGAMGYINKEEATSSIITAIEHVLDNKIYLGEKASDQLLSRAIGRSDEAIDEPLVASLSDRELEVFQMFGHGLDTQQVAERMHISPKTVETYRARIKEKLNLSGGITELICRAAQFVMENG